MPFSASIHFCNGSFENRPVSGGKVSGPVSSDTPLTYQKQIIQNQQVTMKTILSFFFSLVLALGAAAQTPNLLNYQGVAKGANGAVLVSKPVTVRLSIMAFPGWGTVYYSEIRLVTTSATGVFAFQIGSPGALTTTGNLTSVHWNLEDLSLKTEIDPNGGLSFINLGSQKFSTTPFAKYADVANGIADGATFNPANISGTGVAAGAALQAQMYSTIAVATPTIPASSLTLPADLVGTFSDARPALYLGNSGTGNVVRVNSFAGGKGMDLFSSNGSALTAETNSATAEALRVSNANTGSAISVVANGLSSTAVKAQSTGNGLALSISGKVKFKGGKYTPVNGSVATAASGTGEIYWMPTRVAAKATGLWLPIPIVDPNAGTRIQFDIEKYDLGNNLEAVRTFTAPCHGEYKIDARAVVAAFDGGAWTTPLLQNATLFARIIRASPGSNGYDATICRKVSPYGRSSELCLSGETYANLSAGDKVEFYVKAESTEVTPTIEDATMTISLAQAK